MPKKIVPPKVEENLETLEDEFEDELETEENLEDEFDDELEIEETLEKIEESLSEIQKLTQENSDNSSQLVNQGTVISNGVQNKIEIVNQNYEDLGIPYCKKCGEIFLVDLYQKSICPINSSECSRNIG